MQLQREESFSTVVWWPQPPAIQRDRRADTEGDPTDAGPPHSGVCTIIWAVLARRDGDLGSERVTRVGEIRVSRRTADPDNPYDAGVAAELHHHLGQRLGILANVKPAAQHLGALSVQQRLAIRRCTTRPVRMPQTQQHLLGGLIIDTTASAAIAAVDEHLDPRERDIVLLWVEKRLPDLADPALVDAMAAKATAAKGAGPSGWQQKTASRYELRALRDQLHLFL